jgi:hypothetical protein
MNERERYVVCFMDGTMKMDLAYTFAEVISHFDEDEIWQITKLHYDEIEEEQK